MPTVSPLPFLLLVVLAATGSSLASQQLRTGGLSTHIQRSTCQPFDGNSDFYGLGIRLGVYLQWFSSWITNTWDPNTAASNHDANSIFVLAIIVAVLVSLVNNTIMPIEAYIMLLFCFGFFYTVLSHLGVRLYFMNPGSGSRFIAKVKNAWLKAKTWWRDVTQEDLTALRTNSLAGPTVMGKKLPFDPDSSLVTLVDTIWTATIWLFPRTGVKALSLAVSFKAASLIKHPAVSWGGGAWRSAIAALVSIANIWLWFSPWRSDVSTDTSCTPTIFLFGEWKLQGRTVTFLKVASITIAIPEFLLCLVFTGAISKSLLLAEIFIFRHFAVQTVEARKAGGWDELVDKHKLLLGLFANMTSGQTSALAQLRLLSELSPDQNGTTFWTLKKADLPNPTDLINAQISFWCRGIESSEKEAAEDAEKPGTTANVMCLLFYLMILATVGCFITFIEMAILRNGISGVYTIGTTGQLIPFIIGIVSFFAAGREIMFARLREKYPEWHAYFLSLSLGGGYMELKRTNAQITDSRLTGTQQPSATATAASGNPPHGSLVGVTI